MFHVEHARAYDVVVVGGGHAGVEAAAAASRRGASVALVTFRTCDIGRMSCNPSIGGVGKGHLVREVDALGGILAVAADQATIHRRLLNRSKGAAVRGPRVQADRKRFADAVQGLIARERITVIEDEVVSLSLSEQVSGLKLASGAMLAAQAIVITTGTFLGATLFRGSERWEGGRVGDRASHVLAKQVTELGLAAGRLKTGTPPRLDGRTIDWSKLEPQPSDRDIWALSVEGTPSPLSQLACGITKTTEHTHDVIRNNLGESPLHSGNISGRGPRYCPSIEDKVLRFADRESHQIFVEPEGLDDSTIYPNGLSTSLPASVQERWLRTIPGFEEVRMTEPGYAVEYAFIEARNLSRDLQHREVSGLFFAGQVNGTTGYEEAAAQGLLAGANAASVAVGLEPLILEREEAYLGVLADDLTLQGVAEPYRMLTARAENRLHLRSDNAATRLAGRAMKLALLSESRAAAIESRAERQEVFRERAEEKIEWEGEGLSLSQAAVRDRHRLTRELSADDAEAEVLDDWVYAPYLVREQSHWEKASNSRRVIPATIDFSSIPGLSTEMSERLTSAKPDTLERASRVPGVTPAALTAIHFHLERSS